MYTNRKRPREEPSKTAREQKVHVDEPEAVATVARSVYEYGLSCARGGESLVLLCIGTDRSIGDAFGPLVGTILTEAGERGYNILGTLDRPVHAGNLIDTVKWIDETYPNPLIVAVDACLGRSESVGLITVGKGCLRPGAGVNKTLPSVGHLCVTGVVNVGGFMEYVVLQNTRLSFVRRMARVAAGGVGEGLRRLVKEIQNPVASGTRPLI